MSLCDGRGVRRAGAPEAEFCLGKMGGGLPGGRRVLRLDFGGGYTSTFDW